MSVVLIVIAAKTTDISSVCLFQGWKGVGMVA
jgi:hypothetical protein